MFYNILCMFVFLFFIFVFYFVYSLFLYRFSFVYSSLFPICVQTFRPLPPGGNPTAVNEYHIKSRKKSTKTLPVFT